MDRDSWSRAHAAATRKPRPDPSFGRSREALEPPNISGSPAAESSRLVAVVVPDRRAVPFDRHVASALLVVVAIVPAVKSRGVRRIGISGRGLEFLRRLPSLAIGDGIAGRGGSVRVGHALLTLSRADLFWKEGSGQRLTLHIFRLEGQPLA